MAKPPYRSRKSAAPPKPPETAEEGAALMRAYALRLFDRQNGEGANWPLMASSLFRAAFDALDRLPDTACRRMAGRVHAGAYERVTEGPKAAPAAGMHQAAPLAPSNGFDLEANGPGGAKGPFSAS